MAAPNDGLNVGLMALTERMPRATDRQQQLRLDS